MNAYRANGGYSGMEYDRWVEQRAGDTNDKSTITKIQQQYWVTKQTVRRKFGKKEDECIVASDAELDAKLDLFRSIQDSCHDLQRIIDKYQERLCILAQEENSMGRFLKESGKTDKTRAGKMMTAVGKSLSYSGQQRLALRVPLLRLHQEVDTFRHRAIEDTLCNVRSMEKIRIEYRASLNWMKNVSTELDPDTFQQLDRFRKVQGQVRRNKDKFDKLKLDCLQKIDLLTAARCNMFSHALILYQNSLIQFAEKTAKTFATITNSFKGYQHYEFCVVKELTEASSQLAEQTAEKQEPEPETDTDKLLFFESEYQDEPDSASAVISETLASLSLGAPPLLDLSLNESVSSVAPDNSMGDFQSSADDMALLEEILRSDRPETNLLFDPEPSASDTGSFMPSHLLDLAFHDSPITPSKARDCEAAELSEIASGSKAKPPKAGPKEKLAWLDLFADLDPLADPDSVGRGQDFDRNC